MQCTTIMPCQHIANNITSSSLLFTGMANGVGGHTSYSVAIVILIFFICMLVVGFLVLVVVIRKRKCKVVEEGE